MPPKNIQAPLVQYQVLQGQQLVARRTGHTTYRTCGRNSPTWVDVDIEKKRELEHNLSTRPPYFSQRTPPYAPLTTSATLSPAGCSQTYFSFSSPNNFTHRTERYKNYRAGHRLHQTFSNPLPVQHFYHNGSPAARRPASCAEDSKAGTDPTVYVCTQPSLRLSLHRCCSDSKIYCERKWLTVLVS